MSKLSQYKQFCITADARGFLTCVERYAAKQYAAIVNGELQRVYKQRRSCYQYFYREFKKLNAQNEN
jgi:hypothetical protein